MNIKSSFFLAFRFLIPRFSTPSNAKKSVVGSIVCIALTLIPLIVVLVTSDSMIEGITQRVISLSSYDLQVSLPYVSQDDSKNASFYKNYCEKIAQVQNVKSAVVERQGVALASSKTARTGSTIRGIDNDVMQKNDSFKKYLTVVEGDFDLSEKNSAVIGKKLASILDLKIGDTMRIISSDTKGNTIKPRIATFRVKGIVSCGYQELDALWVFIPIETSFNLFRYASSRLFIGVETQNPFDAFLDETAMHINETLDYKCSIYTWRELNQSQFQNYSSTKLLLVLIMSLIVLVATINVSSSIVMIVMEKRKEIAILKSVGASSKGIIFTFLLIALFIGFCGILVGVPLGILCSVNVNFLILHIEKILNAIIMFFAMLTGSIEKFSAISIMNPEFYLETINVVLPFKEIFAVACLVLILSVVVSIVPSVKAGREKPLGILKKV